MTANTEKIKLLHGRIESAYKALESCILCPRRCRINRLAGESGVCMLGEELMVSSMSLHHGEEPPISATRGSGTVFFTSCNLLCVFCQNHPISHSRQGKTLTPDDLAEGMLSLQDRGAHNINLVTPTHLVPQIMKALLIAFREGLDIPIVYNTGGYDSLEVLALLDGIVDIYMPDMKYSDNHAAKLLSNVSDYPVRNREAVKEMYRQVGGLQMDADGVATNGLLIRHLVLPNDYAGTKDTMEFIALELSSNTFISLMGQYFPDYRAEEFPDINGRLTVEEYDKAQAVLRDAGLSQGWIQRLGIDNSVFNIRRYLKED